MKRDKVNVVNDFQFLHCKETTYSAVFPSKISEL
jgi:hypothetical protein